MFKPGDTVRLVRKVELMEPQTTIYVRGDERNSVIEFDEGWFDEEAGRRCWNVATKDLEFVCRGGCVSIW